jgi:hypothetical protein
MSGGGERLLLIPRDQSWMSIDFAIAYFVITMLYPFGALKRSSIRYRFAHSHLRHEGLTPSHIEWRTAWPRVPISRYTFIQT